MDFDHGLATHMCVFILIFLLGFAQPLPDRGERHRDCGRCGRGFGNAVRSGKSRRALHSRDALRCRQRRMRRADAALDQSGPNRDDDKIVAVKDPRFPNHAAETVIRRSRKPRAQRRFRNANPAGDFRDLCH
jgi:hypothetical protein